MKEIDKGKSIITTIPPEVEALIPPDQLKVTKDSLYAYSDAILRLEERLKKCPSIKETDRLKQHPAVFHYFLGNIDIYICEYDGEDTMFGYGILGDLYNSEWGYFSLSEIKSINFMNIDYHFKEQSIEIALYKRYPDYFENPEIKENILLKIWAYIKNLFYLIKTSYLKMYT